MANLSQEVNLIIVVSFFLLLVAVGIITLVLVYRRRQVEYIHEQQRLKTEFEKELLGAQLQIQEQTMKQIAQEIHDNIGGTLSLAKLNLNTIKPANEEETLQKIGSTGELVTKAITNLRSISKSLNGEAILSGGIIKAIETELKLIEKAGAFETEMNITGEPFTVDPQKELILFRTVQEALNNAIKHSEASLLHVKLNYDKSGLQLTIEDDGKGFNKHALDADPETGSGLRNMHDRAKLIGASISIDGTNGTRIQITLPIIA